jgi:hypothetical protein
LGTLVFKANPFERATAISVVVAPAGSRNVNREFVGHRTDAFDPLCGLLCPVLRAVEPLTAAG